MFIAVPPGSLEYSIFLFSELDALIITGVPGWMLIVLTFPLLSRLDALITTRVAGWTLRVFTFPLLLVPPNLDALIITRVQQWTV